MLKSVTFNNNRDKKFTILTFFGFAPISKHSHMYHVLCIVYYVAIWCDLVRTIVNIPLGGMKILGQVTKKFSFS